SDDAGGRNGARVRSLVLRQKWFLRNHIDGSQCFFQSRNRLQISDDADLFAVRDTTFNPAGPVAEVIKPLLLGIVCDLIVSLGAAVISNTDTLTDFNRFHGVDTHDRLGQPAVEPRVPARM